MRIVKQKVELLWATPYPEKCIEAAGRTCYKSEDKITEESAEGFVDRLNKSGHTAMLEFADACFRFTVDRGITHEIVRHRIASYAQESTRYCNYSGEKFGKEITVIEPPGLDPHSRAQWVLACKGAEIHYFNMLQFGCSPQIARSVLPTCTKAEIVMKCNMTEWKHFIRVRSAAGAHPQMIPVAKEVLAILTTIAPNIFKGM